MRDSQRQKVYDAEIPIREKVPVIGEISGVENFVNKVILNKHVASKYGKQLSFKVGVRITKGWAFARGGYIGISIPNKAWARNMLVIIHELAHVIVQRTFYSVAPHGHEFCEVYLNLTRYTLGEEIHDLLKENFKKHGVRFKPKAIRNFSPEHREALRVRMESVRSQRTELKALRDFL